MRHIIAFFLVATLFLSAAEETVLPVPISASKDRILGAAHFEIDEDSKTLIVTTDAETNEAIQRIIAELDRPVPQALINVLFVEVTHGKEVDIGTEISYSSTNSKGDSTDLSSIFDLAGLTSGGSAAIIEGDLGVTLKALAEKTKTEILSRPSIMARNNEESTITIGSEVPFVTNSQVSDSGQITNTIEYQDIGIILTVTPHISSDGTVELEVAPEISSIGADTVQVSEGVVAATYDKRSAQTRVVVPSGKTVVIGGLIEDSETEKISKIPILGSIPYIGPLLFGRKTTDVTKRELLIFLTPNVVTSKTAEKASLEHQKSFPAINKKQQEKKTSKK